MGNASILLGLACNEASQDCVEYQTTCASVLIELSGCGSSATSYTHLLLQGRQAFSAKLKSCHVVFFLSLFLISMFLDDLVFSEEPPKTFVF